MRLALSIACPNTLDDGLRQVLLDLLDQVPGDGAVEPVVEGIEKRILVKLKDIVDELARSWIFIGERRDEKCV